MRTRTFVAAGLLVAFLVAGVVSFYASGNPDGLEYVAEETGFIDTAEDPATADSPLADYGTRGIGDERASVAVAGVIGAGVTLLVMGGIVHLVRLRAPRTDEREPQHTS